MIVRENYDFNQLFVDTYFMAQNMMCLGEGSKKHLKRMFSAVEFHVLNDSSCCSNLVDAH